MCIRDRYSYIEDLCRKTVKKTGESKAQQRSYRIDSVLTHKYLAIPIFIPVSYTHLLDTHIKLLRSSLGKYRDLIVTLRGVGYRFEA